MTAGVNTVAKKRRAIDSKEPTALPEVSAAGSYGMEIVAVIVVVFSNVEDLSSKLINHHIRRNPIRKSFIYYISCLYSPINKLLMSVHIIDL